MFDGLWQERLPVTVPETAERFESFGEDPPLSLQYGVERLVQVIQDG